MIQSALLIKWLATTNLIYLIAMEKIVETKTPSLVVADDLVVSLEYKLTVDAEVVDFSEEGEPLEFIQGHGEIIPGLENQLYGMAIGDSKQIDVKSDDAYGKLDPTAYMDVPRKEFPAEIPLDIGTVLQVKDTDGDVLNAQISEVTPESIKLNFNHPLAGKDLQFQVTVTDLRLATTEEIDHGHVHGDAYDEDEEDYEEGEEEGEEVDE
jgi:FKBP-type peptidyl-prolyl cis-trans isomerase SlyD